MTESDRGVSGRVQSLIIHGTKGNVTVKGLAFQSIFGLRSTLFDFYSGKGTAPESRHGEGRPQARLYGQSGTALDNLRFWLGPRTGNEPVRGVPDGPGARRRKRLLPQNFDPLLHGYGNKKALLMH